MAQTASASPSCAETREMPYNSLGDPISTNISQHLQQSGGSLALSLQLRAALLSELHRLSSYSRWMISAATQAQASTHLMVLKDAIEDSEHCHSGAAQWATHLVGPPCRLLQEQS